MKPKIMYVDDVEANHFIFEQQLDTQEWDIIYFLDPIEASKQLLDLNPCIVVSDQNMPQMQGSKLLGIVKNELPNAMRIILTGNSEEESAIDAINSANAFAYIKKPFKKGELEEVIRRAYQHYSAEMLSHSINPLTIPDLKKKMLEDLSNKTSPDSDLRRLYNLFQFANEDLKINIPEKVLEDWTVLVGTVMSARQRHYHTNQHIFTMSATDDSIEVLAAIFHDLAYINVDRRIHPMMTVYLSDFEFINETNPSSISEPKATDVLCIKVPKDFQKALNPVGSKWVCDIFKVVPEQTLYAMTGANEFLSAMFAVRTLGSYLKGWELLQVLTCIEATIPFRKKSSDGMSIADQFKEKLKKVIFSCGLTVSENQIEKAIKRWVNVANLDVITFGSNDLGIFLGNTWTLILEGNNSFNNPTYTIKEYRIALEKNDSFFKFLIPDVVFRKYRDFPVNYEILVNNCEKNLKNGIEYINAKQIAVLAQEAVALLTGGMCPIALFNGKRHSEPGEPANRLENYLDHSIPNVDISFINPIVYQFLNEGRPSEIKFDLKNSPLATYFYTRLTDSQRDEILKAGRLFCLGKVEPSEFLKLYPKRLILSLLKGLIEIAPTRANEFQILIESLKKT